MCDACMLYVITIDLSLLPTRGPCSKYEIPNEDDTGSIKGKLTFTLESEPLKVSILYVGRKNNYNNYASCL